MLPLEAYAPSQALCETHATSFSLAAKFLPLEKRLAAYALYGFCRYTDNIIDSTLPIPTRKKELHAWKKKLENEWEKSNSNNSILRVFVTTCKENNIPKELGFALIQGLEKDLHPAAFKNFNELHDYCYSAGAIPGLLMAFACGAPARAQKYAISLGIAMQLTNILRDIQEDIQAGRMYLPENEMRQFNITQMDLRSGKINKHFKSFMQFQIARARSYYSRAEKGMEFIPPDARTAMQLCLHYYQEILTEIEKAHYDVLSQRVHVSAARKQEIVSQLNSSLLLTQQA